MAAAISAAAESDDVGTSAHTFLGAEVVGDEGAGENEVGTAKRLR